MGTAPAMGDKLTVVDHPLVQHKLTLMRRKQTPTGDFRRLLREIGMLLAYEVMRDLPLGSVAIETPVAKTVAPILDGETVCLVSVLRAGSGLVEGMLDVLPTARVGHIGLYRDPDTLAAVEYFCKLPEDIHLRQTIVVDPMLATGNTAVAAVQRVKDAGGRNIKLACLLTVPEGLATFAAAHGDVPVFVAAVDERLNEKGYIVPGIGDAGDRLYGTK